MPSSKNKEKRKGMTLTELLVVIAMISIITSVTWVNFRRFGRSFDVERDIGRMAQEVRGSLAMTMAMEDRTIPAECGVITNPIVSYGVNFQDNSSSYERRAYFIEGANNARFGEIICSERVKTINLEQDLMISSIRVLSEASWPETSGLDIIFTPPHPRTYIGGIVVTGNRWRSKYDAAEISISLPETGAARTIRVNKAGMIEIIQPGP